MKPEEVEGLAAMAKENPSALVLIFAVILGVASLRLAEAIVRRYLPSSFQGKSSCGMTAIEREQLAALYKMHSRFDVNGRPVWYTQDDPDLQKAMAELLAKAVETQRDTLKIVERIERRLEAFCA